MTTYKTLKADVVRGLKRHTYVSSSVPTSGSTTAFTDTARQEPDRFWSLDGANTWVKFGAATGVASVNEGLVRRVTGYSTNSTFVFAPAATASVASGSSYELYKGPHPDTDVGLAINETIRATFPERLVSSVATTHEQEDVRTYAVPSAVANTVTKLKEVRRSVGTINSDYHFTVLREGFDYRTIENNGTLTLQLQYLPTPSLVLTLIGERAASELSADTDTTDEPAAVILAGARHYLALQEGNAELARFWQEKFEQAKKDYAKSTPPRQLRRPHFTVGW